MNKTFYCTKCGRQLQARSTGAENYWFDSEADSIYTVNAYNQKTGKRQIVFRYTCPMYKKAFGLFENGHNDFMHDDIYQEIEFGNWELVK